VTYKNKNVKSRDSGTDRLTNFKLDDKYGSLEHIMFTCSWSFGQIGRKQK